MQANGGITLQEPIIFYDGVCGVCNWFVQQVVKADKAGIFRFAPIQGETAEEYLGKPGDNPKAWTIYMIDGDGVHNASTAVLKIYKRVGIASGLATVALGFPVGFRDWVYGLVAKNRYRIFGKVDQCQIPTPAVKARLLP